MKLVGRLGIVAFALALATGTNAAQSLATKGTTCFGERVTITGHGAP